VISGDASMNLSRDLFVSSVTRIKIPVVLGFDIVLSPQMVYHEIVYRIALFKMDPKTVK